jgi:AcrR family transcriptional regulator
MIDAGIELINEKGADGFSLRKVAERCGVSHSAPYKHFKNKDDFDCSHAGTCYQFSG